MRLRNGPRRVSGGDVHLQHGLLPFQLAGLQMTPWGNPGSHSATWETLITWTSPPTEGYGGGETIMSCEELSQQGSELIIWQIDFNNPVCSKFCLEEIYICIFRLACFLWKDQVVF